MLENTEVICLHFTKNMRDNLWISFKPQKKLVLDKNFACNYFLNFSQERASVHYFENQKAMASAHEKALCQKNAKQACRRLAFDNAH